MRLTRGRGRDDAALQAWRATGRSDVEFVAGCLAHPYVPMWNVQVVSTVPVVPSLLSTFGAAPLTVAIAAVLSAVFVAAWVIVGREGRRRAAAMVIPFPTDRRGGPAPGLLAVGTTEVVVWAKPGFLRAPGEPVAAVPRARIDDAIFEDGHRLMGGGWIHVVGLDGERAALTVRPRDVAAARRVTYALARQAVPSRW